MKTSVRSLSLFASVAALALAAPALATVYMPIEDADLLRRADAVVVARATGATVVPMQGGLPETRTRFEVIETLSGAETPYVEVAVPGGELPGGLTLSLQGVPHYSTGGLYVIALKARPDGAFAPAELGLGSFEVLEDEAGRHYATRSMFLRERVAVLQREADGTMVPRPEPLRELAAFTSWVRAGLFREAQLPGAPAYVVAKASGKLELARQGVVEALWDTHWCPGGAPSGTCGDDFDRYRWVDPSATVRWCDENSANFGQSGVAGGGSAEFQNSVFLWTNDPTSNVRYTYATPLVGACNPAAIPAAATVPIYLDDLVLFGGEPFTCPFVNGGALAVGGVVTDNTYHGYKGETYKTIRAGIGWVRRADSICTAGDFSRPLYQTIISNILGSTLGFTPADLTRNPNDTDETDDLFALMQSTYLTLPSPTLGADDRAGLCFLYGECVGTPVEAKLFVPFVGRVLGQAEAMFTSEMALTNRSETDSIVTIDYTPSIGTGRGSTTQLVPAGRQILIPDVIEFLRTKGVPIPETGNAAGTLQVTFPGVYDFDAAVVVRTGTPVPPTVKPEVGRAGLAYLGVHRPDLLLDPAWLLGLRKTASDRSNIAFQHAGVEADGPIRLRATWYSATGTVGGTPVERTLTGGGWTQFDLTTLEPEAVEGYVKVELVEGRAPWYAYGVVNDEKTSDGSFIAPIPDEVLMTQETLILPVAVEAGPYVTEIILDNVTDVTKTARLKWVADQLPGEFLFVDYVLPAGQQIVIPDWVAVLRNAGQTIPPKGTRLAGAIFLSVTDGTVAGVSISARVVTPAADPVTLGAKILATGPFGDYGVHYPAERTTCLTNQASWLAGLRQDDVNRTNMAIINTGEVDGSAATYRVELFDGDLGTKAGEIFVSNLPYERYIQVDRVLLRINPDVKNGFIRVTSVSGPNPFITYAVINDGSEPGKRSGDGAYIQSEIVAIK